MKTKSPLERAKGLYRLIPQTGRFSKPIVNEKNLKMNDWK